MPKYLRTARIARMRIIPKIRILLVILLISQTVSRRSLPSSSGVIFAATSTTRFHVGVLPLEPFQLYCHEVVSIGALHFDGISWPPGHAPAELEGLQVGEDLVVEKSTKPSGIMAAYLEALAYRVPGAAISFDIGYSCHDFATQFWIFCHLPASLI